MAKLSRSKQPDFDPREIDDLIFTPAVGSGVGSHLVRSESELTTVDTPSSLGSASGGEEKEGRDADVTSTVDNTDLSPVVTMELWRTESGDIVPESRVRRIRLAQDILSPAEKTVYDTLWNSKQATRGDGDAWRIVQAGYHLLVKRTKLSRKTIQRVIDRLLHKDFIAIEVPADIYNRTSTTYRVFSYWKALDIQGAKGRFYAVKIGPGFVFADKLESATELRRVSMTAEDSASPVESV